MKHTITLIILFLLLTFTSLFAQADSLNKANDFYSQGKYDLAIEIYESVLADHGFAPELYYNLGNAYYKQNEIGRSILNYERALRLNPSYSNAQQNLQFVQLKVVDNVVALPSFFLKRWMELFVKMLSSNQWLFLSVIAFVLGLVAVLLFVFGNSYILRRVSFYFSSVFVAGFVVFLVFAGIRKNQLEQHNDAIIMIGSVTVKSSPDKNGTDLFQLHEGTKVAVQSQVGAWTEIVLGNGNIGWIESLYIEVI